MDLRRLDAQLSPDVLVLIEVTGLQEANLFASHLGWSDYQAVVSDFSDARQEAFEGLEVAVISKLPIASAPPSSTLRQTGFMMFLALLESYVPFSRRRFHRLESLESERPGE